MSEPTKTREAWALAIVAFVAVAAGVGRWWMDGAQSDGAKFVSALRQDPQMLINIIVIPGLLGTAWVGIRVWFRRVRMLRRARDESSQV